MLKPQKSKMNKKELKKDPLLDSVMKAQTFYETNKNNITYSIIGVIIAALLVVWVVALQDEDAVEATTLLGKAQVEYDTFNFSKARIYLTKLREKSGFFTPDAKIQGTFLLANLEYNEENYVQAKNLFTEFIDSYSGSEILVSSAYAGVAACEEQENNFIAAAENYEKAYSISDDLPLAAEYLYLAGVNYLNADNSTKAIEIFQQIIDEFPDSPKKYDAQTNLILASAQ